MNKRFNRRKRHIYGCIIRNKDVFSLTFYVICIFIDFQKSDTSSKFETTLTALAITYNFLNLLKLLSAPYDIIVFLTKHGCYCFLNPRAKQSVYKSISLFNFQNCYYSEYILQSVNDPINRYESSVARKPISHNGCSGTTTIILNYVEFELLANLHNFVPYENHS